MSKTYYSDYVKHALRFYTRYYHPPVLFKTEADRANWLACDDVFKTYADSDVKMLFEVYSGRDTLADEVYNAAKKRNINQNIIWDLMKAVEYKIAAKRNLI